MALITPDLRKSLKIFAVEARRCANPDFGHLKFERFRLHNGIAFEVTDVAFSAQNAFINQAVRRLGPTKGHAKVIDKAIWDYVVSIQDDSELEDPKNLNIALAQIEEKSASVCEFFRPCPLVLLPEGVDVVEIGRVSVVRSAAKIKDFTNVNKRLKFEVGAGWSVETTLSGEEILTTLPPTMWVITLAAADPIREEEGLWLTDVALSLLRMSVPHEVLGPLAPTIGKVEPHPFFPHDTRDHSLALNQEGGMKMGGMTAPNDYRLTDAAVQQLSEKQTIDKVDKVFEAKPKSVAERFFQGCGWLTRGRRSKDRSDRLLYFFTAIEALLSDSDKSSPVIQTISRHSAVLLSDDNNVRHKISRDIKRLYSVRSALVHAGARGAFDFDSNLAQNVAERLYLKVWNEINLSDSHSDFSAALGRASYGLVLSDILNCGDSTPTPPQ